MKEPPHGSIVAEYLKPRLPDHKLEWTARELAELVQIPESTVQRAIRHLRFRGVVEHVGERRDRKGSGRHPYIYRTRRKR